MPTALSHYLENLRGRLKLDDAERSEVIREFETHIEDRLQELKQSGLTEEEAARTCINLMGSAAQIAQQLYEAHSQGSWKQTLLASIPPALFGLLFALNWWDNLIWRAVLLAIIISTVIYGWRHGKPTWVFPWLGYSLIPVILAGFALLYLPKEWSLITLPAYFLLNVWWLQYILIYAIKRDWIFISLMFLPIPIAAGWFLAAAPDGKINELALQQIYEFAPFIGLTFLALALGIATFIRLRQRWLRIIVLSISGIITLATIAYFTNGRLSLPAFIILILVMWGIFIIPALLEQRIRKLKKTGALKPRNSPGG